MKTKFILTVSVALILGTALCAQEKKEPEATSGPLKGWVSKVVEIKHRDVSQFVGLLGALGVRGVPSPELKVIALSGPSDMVEAAAKAIQRLDVPSAAAKNIELTVYLLSGSPDAAQAGKIPPELEGVTKQLRGLFSYQSFHLLETMILRVRDGEDGEANGVGPAPDSGVGLTAKSSYRVMFRSVSLTAGDKGNVVRIGRLMFSSRVPVGNPLALQNAGFTTGVDVGEGQKVVVGKANIDGSNSAMFLVVTARVVD